MAECIVLRVANPFRPVSAHHHAELLILAFLSTSMSTTSHIMADITNTSSLPPPPDTIGTNDKFSSTSTASLGEADVGVDDSAGHGICESTFLSDEKIKVV